MKYGIKLLDVCFESLLLGHRKEVSILNADMTRMDHGGVYLVKHCHSFLLFGWIDLCLCLRDAASGNVAAGLASLGLRIRRLASFSTSRHDAAGVDVAGPDDHMVVILPVNTVYIIIVVLESEWYMLDR